MSIKTVLLSITLMGSALPGSSVQADVLATSGVPAPVTTVTLRFCYEDKQLLPYYAGNSADIPEQPGATIEHLRLCLAHRFDNSLVEKISSQSAITVSRPLGYRPIPFPANTALVAAHSPEHALELVVSGRVDATTVLCQLNGINAKEQHLNRIPVLLLYPPLYQSDGYLMLSQGFYQQYPQHAERLWQALPATLDKNRYLQYLDYPFF